MWILCLGCNTLGLPCRQYNFSIIVHIVKEETDFLYRKRVTNSLISQPCKCLPLARFDQEPIDTYKGIYWMLLTQLPFYVMAEWHSQPSTFQPISTIKLETRSSITCYNKMYAHRGATWMAYYCIVKSKKEKGCIVDGKQATWFAGERESQSCYATQKEDCPSRLKSVFFGIINTHWLFLSFFAFLFFFLLLLVYIDWTSLQKFVCMQQ